ncbi:MAG: hypothetical protein AMJ81_14170 [Phycisphaerae bacterium SM23_33]|nr:MAG: hypothetical protein AMJ81_14170 [Phycisphaerae bacterium SM23_33]
MNQDGDSINGEGEDAFNATIWFAPELLVLGDGGIDHTEGFEEWAADVPAHWAFGTTGNARVRLEATGESHSGAYHLRLDKVMWEEVPAAVLALDVSAYSTATDLYCTFWSKCSVPDTGTVYLDLSADGLSWQNAVWSSALGRTYEVHTVDLDAEAQDHGLSLAEPLLLRWRHSHGGSATADCLLDDVRVTLDVTAPQVVLDMRAERVLPAGTPELTLNFTEPVQGVAESDISLQESALGPIVPDDVVLAPDGMSAALTFAAGLLAAAAPDTYTLRVLDSVMDMAGNPLDGDGDGTPGGDYQVSFSVFIPGDANGNGVVDGLDYNAWSLHYQQAGGWAEGDFNGDGTADGLDYNIWSIHYLDEVGQAPAGAQTQVEAGEVTPALAGLSVEGWPTGADGALSYGEGSAPVAGGQEGPPAAALDLLGVLGRADETAGETDLDFRSYAWATASASARAAGRKPALGDDLEALAGADLSALPAAAL